MDGPLLPRRVSFLLLLAISGGCRNLGTDEAGKGPNIRFVHPTEGLTIPLSTVAELEVTDPSGVAQVSLACGAPDADGGAPLYLWSTPPYLANIDLQGCKS